MDDSIVFYVQWFDILSKFERFKILAKYKATEPPVATGETDQPMNGAKTGWTKF